MPPFSPGLSQHASQKRGFSRQFCIYVESRLRCPEGLDTKARRAQKPFSALLKHLAHIRLLGCFCLFVCLVFEWRMLKAGTRERQQRKGEKVKQKGVWREQKCIFPLSMKLYKLKLWKQNLLCGNTQILKKLKFWSRMRWFFGRIEIDVISQNCKCQ